jgi:hypothetical protein
MTGHEPATVPTAMRRGYPGLAMALASSAVLLHEVAITRVLSVVLWYHFAFLAVSIAMLGLALPGVWFSFHRPHPAWLPRSLLASGCALPTSVLLVLRSGDIAPRPDGLGSAWTLAHGQLLVIVGALLLPTLGLGSAVCLLLLEAREKLARAYAADLLGAAAAAVAVVPLMHVLPTPALISASGLLPVAAAICVAPGYAWHAVGAAALIVAFSTNGSLLSVHRTKSYDEPGNILAERWTPTARLVVFPSAFFAAESRVAFGWGLGSHYRPEPLEQLWIEQDGSAGTPMTRLTGSPGDLPHLMFDVTSLGYQLRRPRDVCIIGAGGGRDVLTALAAGAEHVDAVELNPAMVEIVSGQFGRFSGDIYHRRGVRAVIGEGRSFLARASKRYDLIQVSLIDSWAATAAGAFALSENYLYTTEAARAYLEHLEPDGVLSISRWIGGNHQLESARLAVLLDRALRESGATEPRAHLYVARAQNVATFLVTRRAWTPARLAQLDSVCSTRGFQRYWPPADSVPRSTVSVVLQEGTSAYEQAGFNLDPATDDKPFFFQTVSLFGKVDPKLLAQLSPNESSVGIVRVTLGLVGTLAAALFLLPFVLARRVPRLRDVARPSAYFFAIGLGFMLTELAWLQRFVLYLGHPSYAATVVLGALLLGAGLGSRIAARMRPRIIARWGILVPAAIAVVNLGLGGVMARSQALDLEVRTVVAVMLLAPVGLLMGLPLPAGMAVFPLQGRPWFWAMNGMASVLASASALLLAMSIGLVATVWIAAALYLLAAALLAFSASQLTQAAG